MANWLAVEKAGGRASGGFETYDRCFCLRCKEDECVCLQVVGTRAIATKSKNVGDIIYHANILPLCCRCEFYSLYPVHFLRDAKQYNFSNDPKHIAFAIRSWPPGIWQIMADYLDPDCFNRKESHLDAVPDGLLPA